MVNPMGFRFRPTNKELVDHYLRFKNLGGSTSHIVDEVISTVDIYIFDPWDLPSQSRTESSDQVWYFFGPNKYKKGERQSRKTSYGFWKKTGDTMDIMRKKGNREKIGEKRVFVFHSSKRLQTKWVMHEYLATSLSPNQMMTYTICKVTLKGGAREMSPNYSATEVELNHSLIPHMDNYDKFEYTGLLDLDALDKVFNNLLNDDSIMVMNSLFDDISQKSRL